jgi:hypothetical protein
MGVIDKRIAILDPSVLGLGVTAFIRIKLEKQAQLSLDNFKNSIDRISEVMECYLVMGDSDYILWVIVQNVEDLENVIVNKLSRIPGVSSIRSNLALPPLPSLPENDVVPLSFVLSEPGRFRQTFGTLPRGVATPPLIIPGNGNYAIGNVRWRQEFRTAMHLRCGRRKLPRLEP